MFKKALFWITLIFQGLFKFFRDYVIPVIEFVQFIKELFTSELPDEKQEGFNFNSWLAEKLKMTETLIETLLKAFCKVAKMVLPDIIKAKTPIGIIKEYIAHCKTLNKTQLSMVLLKTASLILVQIVPTDKALKEHQADYFVQMIYSYKYKDLA